MRTIHILYRGVYKLYGKAHGTNFTNIIKNGLILCTLYLPFFFFCDIFRSSSNRTLPGTQIAKK